jgi:hypothetical protein
VGWLRQSWRVLAELTRWQRDSSRRGVSRLFQGEITDSTAYNIRRAIEAVSFNAGVALFVFGIAVIAIVLLHIFEGSWIFGLLILFSILLFYFRMTETRVRILTEQNRAIVLRLAETNRAPQLRLPFGDEPTPRQPRRRRRTAALPSDRLPGL